MSQLYPQSCKPSLSFCFALERLQEEHVTFNDHDSDRSDLQNIKAINSLYSFTDKEPK